MKITKEGKDFVKERYNLKFIEITELDPIDTNSGKITWNKNKSFEKSKSQIEDSVTMKHIPDFDELSKLIKKQLAKNMNYVIRSFKW